MRRLVLLRHGLTDWNAVGRYQGHADVTLSETGVAQAQAVAPAIAAMRPVALWTSDLARAAATAAHVAEACGLPALADPRLRERRVGIFSGMTADEIRTAHPVEAEDFFSGGAPLDTESEQEVEARMVAALRDLGQSSSTHGTAVAISHGWAIRMAVTSLVGASPTALHGLDNCGWAELVHRGGSWSLLAWNRVVG
ncbi:histidine phosphatase family protein [uncultured Nocardioides sp.]|uniref:histidine phosphatase family protein n=1 Tax=uncultured Nocardioides sp. TaxID=198441 RepID=UPI002620562A|nr:histidine phosphatase family protein [uncultured Nocardioides sp.]